VKSATERRVKPVISVRALVERLDKLEHAEPKQRGWKRVVAAMRAAPLSAEWSPDDVERVAGSLARLDPTWGVGLRVLDAQLPDPRAVFTRVLSEQLIAAARTATKYPSLDGAALDAAGTGSRERVREWLRSLMPREPKTAVRTPPALAMCALWGDRSADWFADAVLTLTEEWLRFDPSARSTSKLGKAAVALAPGDRAADARAAAVVVMAQALRAEARRTELLLMKSQRDLASLGEARDALSRQLSATAEQARTANVELQDARANLATLEDALSAARSDADNERRALQAQATNTVGKVRADVLTVLRHETRQIRRYLEAPQPDAVTALQRLSHIERLVVELEKD
jgi:hypothetical protein